MCLFLAAHTKMPCVLIGSALTHYCKSLQLRRGTACGKPAIFKCFDFSRTPAAEEDLLWERDLFSKVTSIQVGPVARICSNA